MSLGDPVTLAIAAHLPELHRTPPADPTRRIEYRRPAARLTSGRDAYRGSLASGGARIAERPRRGAARPGAAGQGLAGHGAAGQGKAWRGAARRAWK
jgi:hypothetical protein